MRPWFVQMLWKEYREQRAFWLATTLMAGAAVVVSRVSWTRGSGIVPNPWTQGFWISFAAPAVYAAGVGGTLFAAEHERRTFAFLRGLRCRVSQLVVPKVAWALLSMLAMQIALWLVVTALNPAPRVSGFTDLRVDFIDWQLTALTALACGTAFSLVIGEPLRAAVLAALATVGLTFVATSLMARFFPLRVLQETISHAAPLRCFFLALLVGLDYWLARRWAVEATLTPQLLGRRKSPVLLGSGRERIGFLLDFLRQVGALAWQAWRAATPWFWPLGLLAATIVTAEACYPDRYEVSNTHILFTSAPWLVFNLFAAVILAALCGGLAFRADQLRDGRRFLAERGVSVSYFWLSRQVVWGAIAGVWATAVLIVPTMSMLNALWALLATDPPTYDGVLHLTKGAKTPWWWAERNEHLSIYTHLLLTPLFAVPLAFAAGQLASLCLQSSLLAVLLAFVLAGVVLAWAALMTALDISFVWSVLPVFIALLAAGWLRARFWLIDRRNLSSWLATAAPLFVTMLLLGIAVPLHRATEIPLVSFNWDPASESEQEAVANDETLSKLHAAWLDLPKSWLPYDIARRQDEAHTTRRENKVANEANLALAAPSPPTSAETALVQACEPAIQLMIAASKRDDVAPENLSHGRIVDPESRDELSSCFRLLTLAGDAHTAAGKFDEAWEDYLAALRIARRLDDGPRGQIYARLPYWAARDGQSGERICDAIKELQQFHQATTSCFWAKRRLRNDYREHNERLSRLEALAQVGFSEFLRVSPGSIFMYLESRLPWERARVHRLLDLVAMRDLNLVATLEQRLATDDVRMSFLEHFFDSEKILVRGKSLSPWYAQFQRWSRSTHLYVFDAPDGPEICWQAAILESQFRATLILLALEAYKRDNGSLPLKLSSLVGIYLVSVPLDPLMGRPFLYYSSGVGYELKRRQRGADLPPLPAASPFLWSVAGPGLRIPAIRVTVAPRDNDYPQFASTCRGDSKQFALFEGFNFFDESRPDNALENGWAYPVP